MRADRVLLVLAACLFVVALARDTLDRWIAKTDLPVLLTETSPEMLDRDGQLLRLYTVEDGRWRLAVSTDAVDPAYIAMLIAKRAAALLQGTQHDSGQEQPQKHTGTSATVPFGWHVHEAPVACTLTFVCKGVDVHLTMRDVSDDALFARLKRILPKIQKKTHTTSL